MKIIVEKISSSEAEQRGLFEWPIWEKEVSEFPWTYDSTEECYLLEGRVTVTVGGGEEVEIEPGDFVRFPGGLSCHWKIHEAVRKHYQFP